MKKRIAKYVAAVMSITTVLVLTLGLIPAIQANAESATDYGPFTIPMKTLSTGGLTTDPKDAGVAILSNKADSVSYIKSISDEGRLWVGTKNDMINAMRWYILPFDEGYSEWYYYDMCNLLLFETTCVDPYGDNGILEVTLPAPAGCQAASAKGNYFDDGHDPNRPEAKFGNSFVRGNDDGTITFTFEKRAGAEVWSNKTIQVEFKKAVEPIVVDSADSKVKMTTDNTVTTELGCTLGGAKVTEDVLNSGTEYNAAISLMKDILPKATDTVVSDWNITIGDTKVHQFSNYIEMSFKAPANLNADQLSRLRVFGVVDGKLMPQKTWVSGNEVKYLTNHMSTYISAVIPASDVAAIDKIAAEHGYLTKSAVEEAKKSIANDTKTGSNNTTANSGNVATQSSANTGDQQIVKAPKTNNVAPFAVVIALLVSGGVAVGVIVANRK